MLQHVNGLCSRTWDARASDACALTGLLSAKFIKAREESQVENCELYIRDREPVAAATRRLVLFNLQFAILNYQFAML
jgi:hypothetical protein